MLITTSRNSIEAFNQSLPSKVKASNDLQETGCKFYKRDRALQFDYISPNNLVQSHLCFDIDVNQALFVLEDNVVPMPTLIVENKDDKKRAHFLYELNTPILMFDKASDKPKRFAYDVERGLAKLLKADENFNGVFIKNPNSSNYTVYDTGLTYDLHDLNEYVPSHLLKKQKPKYVSNLGRNCQLFDLSRHWAYANVFDFTNLKDFHSAVLEKLTQYNAGLSVALGFKEIGYIAKSVSTWTWKNKANIGTNGKARGSVSDFFDGEWDSLSQHEKQALGASYTNSNRQYDTEQKIVRAIDDLKRQGKKITQESVMILSGVSIRTVRNYWHLSV